MATRLAVVAALIPFLLIGCSDGSGEQRLAQALDAAGVASDAAAADAALQEAVDKADQAAEEKAAEEKAAADQAAADKAAAEKAAAEKAAADKAAADKAAAEKAAADKAASAAVRDAVTPVTKPELAAPPKPAAPAPAPKPAAPAPAEIWNPKNCIGSLVATSKVVVSGNTARLTGTIRNTTGFAVWAGDSSPVVAAWDTDGQSVWLRSELTAVSGDHLILPGQTWSYAGPPRTMQTPQRNWDALAWNPVSMFIDDKVIDFCQSRGVASLHVVD